MNAALSDIACLAVEIRRLKARVAMLEKRADRQRFDVKPLLRERVLGVAAKSAVIEGREIIKALAAEGALDGYQDSTAAAWMAILRETRRGRLRRVGRGKYSLVPEVILAHADRVAGHVRKEAVT